jgi:hypothetical protein
MRNKSQRRLNVIVPPGLVASSTAVGQGGRGGGGGGGGGLQSMGLGSAANREGAFGEFRGNGPVGGLQSVPVSDEPRSREVAVPVGETIELSVPAVCLNFGKPTPTPRDTFTLMDVEEYSTDPRVRRALRSLATFGTSQGVAQAVMWRVCNDLPFQTMIENAGKAMNTHEIALAARFVEALDTSGTGDLVDQSLFSGARIFVQVRGDGGLSDDAKRLENELDGHRLLGLPAQINDADGPPDAAAPALFVRVILAETTKSETKGTIFVSACSTGRAWRPLGKVTFRDNSAASVLDATAFSKAVDRAIAGAFVTVKPARRTLGSTTLKVENRLPFTVTNLVVRAGNSPGSPPVPFDGVGVGPARSTLLPIQAATASLVERIELNGL